MPTTTNSSPDKSLYDEAVEILKRELGVEENRRRYLARTPRFVKREVAEDALNDTIVALLIAFKEYDDAKFEDFFSRPAAFITRQFNSLRIDDYRKHQRRKTEPQSGIIPTKEVGLIKVWDVRNLSSEDMEARSAQEDSISGVLACLAERENAGKPKTTSLSEKELEIYALKYHLGWKGQEIAEGLGEHPGTTSKRLKAIRNKVWLAYYLAGALGRDGSLPLNESSYDACDRHLDAYEESLEKQEKKRLLEAAPSLSTRPGMGTRIIADKYLAKTAKEAADLKLSHLHDSETTYAKAVDNPFPRCVTVCQAHNPDGSDRPLEIAQ